VAPLIIWSIGRAIERGRLDVDGKAGFLGHLSDLLSGLAQLS
jgi:hypothetical protein